MHKVQILTEADLRRLVRLDAAAIECVEQAFAALAGGTVVMPPILRLDIAQANGEVDVKTAYMPGLESFAIKVSPGFFNNPALGLASTNGLMIVLSAKTGLLEALLLDNGYLTDVRTAAAGAVAAKHLARPEARRVTLFGAGMQARLQLEALRLVRDISDVSVWARDSTKAQAFAERAARDLSIACQAVGDPRAAAVTADIVVTTTPATEPILLADWIKAGTHVTAMGSDAEHKNEIDPFLVPRCDLYVPDSLSQTRKLGELRHAIARELVSATTHFAELGAIITGAAPGRTDAEQITLADLTGTGVQDTAIATLARERATAAGAGTTIST